MCHIQHSLFLDLCQCSADSKHFLTEFTCVVWEIANDDVILNWCYHCDYSDRHIGNKSEDIVCLNSLFNNSYCKIMCFIEPVPLHLVYVALWVHILPTFLKLLRCLGEVLVLKGGHWKTTLLKSWPQHNPGNLGSMDRMHQISIALKWITS